MSYDTTGDTYVEFPPAPAFQPPRPRLDITNAQAKGAPMDSAMQRLSKAVDGLDDALGGLVGAIDAVLTPELQVACQPMPGSPPRPARSELVSAIEHRAEALEDITTKIQRLIGRVEL